MRSWLRLRNDISAGWLSIWTDFASSNLEYTRVELPPRVNARIDVPPPVPGHKTRLNGHLSYDNALAETINGLYKADVTHRRGPWRSFEVVELVTPSNR